MKKFDKIFIFVSKLEECQALNLSRKKNKEEESQMDTSLNHSFNSHLNKDELNINRKKFHPLSVEYMTGENSMNPNQNTISNKNYHYFEKNEISNSNANYEGLSTLNIDSVSNICTLIDSVKISFLKLENTLQNEIGMFFYL